MGKTSYFVLLIWIIISFAALLRYVFRFGYPSFLKEFFVILVLLIIALVSLFLVGFRKNAGWVTSAIFFVIILLNMAYLLLKLTSRWVHLNALIAAIGFVFSTAMIGKYKDEMGDYPSADDRIEEWEREAEAMEKAEKDMKDKH